MPPLVMTLSMAAAVLVMLTGAFGGSNGPKVAHLNVTYTSLAS